MTGDGANDAPAVQAADIGIAMGVTGTDVTKQAADMVLVDDNFASIVAAVEEGLGIFDNIVKFVHYLLASNASELMFVFAATLCGWPAPLLAVQILWINLVTDGLPALGLGTEPPEPGATRRKPSRPRAHLLGGGRRGLRRSGPMADRTS